MYIYICIYIYLCINIQAQVKKEVAELGYDQNPMHLQERLDIVRLEADSANDIDEVFM